MDFCQIWLWLQNHPKLNEYPLLGTFTESLWIDVVKVCPETDEISEDETRNTKIQVWLESGIATELIAGKRAIWTHNLSWDCGGDTFEEAIQALYEKIKKDYPWELPEDLMI